MRRRTIEQLGATRAITISVALGLTLASCAEPDPVTPVTIDRVVLIGDSLGE